MGINIIVSCLPQFRDGSVGLLKDGAWFVPSTYLVEGQDFEDVARIALEKHAKIEECNNLALLSARHYKTLDDSGPSIYNIAFICHEPDSGWPDGRMVRTPRLDLPKPVEFNKLSRDIILSYLLRSTGLSSPPTKWNRHWYELAVSR